MLPRSKVVNAAGPRNNFVTVQMAVDGTPSDTGEVLPVWSMRCQRWANCMSKSGREFIAAKTMQPELDSMLELPFDSVTSQITPRDRVLMNGRILNVAAAYDPTNNREKIVLEVMEPVAC